VTTQLYWSAGQASATFVLPKYGLSSSRKSQPL